MRTSLRLSAGLLLEIIGITLFRRPGQSAVEFAGLVVILFALLTGPASSRRNCCPTGRGRRPG